MNKELLKDLKEEPLVYYIYQRDPSIFGIESNKQEYVVVIDSNYEIPKKYKSESFTFFATDKWFDLLLNNDIFVWQCLCLNKKFIIKEYVKLIATPDNLKLRLALDDTLNTLFQSAKSELLKGDFSKGKFMLLNILKQAEFSNQIINHNKIINYTIIKIFSDNLNAVEDDYDKILESFSSLYNPIISEFNAKTDEILYNYKLKKLTKK